VDDKPGERSSRLPQQPDSTLGRTWQRMQRRKEARSDWAPLPPLPTWPPLPPDEHQAQPEPAAPPPPPRRNPVPSLWLRYRRAPTWPPASQSEGAAAQPAPPLGDSSLEPSDLGGLAEHASQQASHYEWERSGLWGQPPEHSSRPSLWRRYRRAPGGVRVIAAVGVSVVVGALGLLLGFGLLAGGRTSATVGAPSVAATLGGAAASATVPTSANPAAATAPAAQPTDTPTPVPTPELTVAFTCASGAIGGPGQVCIHTRANATLSITVHYCDGSDAKSLQGVAHADANGDHTWQWTVSTTCAGAATATVTAKSAGQQVTATTTFTITG
jgi:hypothetical protein